MWLALKADLMYHRVVISLLFFVVLILVIVDCITTSVDVYMMLGISSMVFYASMIIIGATDDKRDRQQRLLPLSQKKTSISRQLFAIVVQGGVTILWLIGFFINYLGRDNTFLLDIIAIGSLNLCVVMFFVIFSDLGQMNTKIYKYLFLVAVLSVFALSICLSVINVYEYPLSFGPEHRKSLWEAIIYSTLMYVMLYFDYRIYLKRTSYLS